MSNSMVVLNFVIRNGEKHLRLFLNSIKNQTYTDFAVNIWDNNSTDKTREIIKTEYPDFKLHESSENIGVWSAMEKLINHQNYKYIICMTDIILKNDFIEKSVKIMEQNSDCGALQAKIYQMNLYGQEQPVFTNIIDTLGFRPFRSRKIINLGQGEKDWHQYDNMKEVFAVEGAIPFFRKEALENCRINGWLIDPNYRTGSIGYGDDLDLAWRMRLFGWKHIFSPEVIGYHDRSTTKGTSSKVGDYFKRIGERRDISMSKKRLDWRNTRWTIIKNDYIIDILRDLPHILWREMMVLGYAIFFEPKILLEFPFFLKSVPKMLSARKQIMARKTIGSQKMRRWFR